jgi:hypothetical protein
MYAASVMVQQTNGNGAITSFRVNGSTAITSYNVDDLTPGEHWDGYQVMFFLNGAQWYAFVTVTNYVA